MNDTVLYAVTGVLAIIALVLFLRTLKSGPSLTEQKRDDVRRKRAALIARKKAEARAEAQAAAERAQSDVSRLNDGFTPDGSPNPKQ